MAAVLRAPRGGFPPKVPGPDRAGRAPAARLPGARPDPPSDPVPDGRTGPPSRDAPVLGPPRPAPLGAAPKPRDPPATPPRAPATPDPRDPPATPPRGPSGKSLDPPRAAPPDAPPRLGAPLVVPVLGARSGRCPPRIMTPTLLGASRPGPNAATALLAGVEVDAHITQIHAHPASRAASFERYDPMCARKRFEVRVTTTPTSIVERHSNERGRRCDARDEKPEPKTTECRDGAAIGDPPRRF